MSNYTLQLIPYLMFDGNCAEALDFYAALFGGKIVRRLTFGELPGDMPIPEEAKGCVVNEMLEMPGGAMLYGGDVRWDMGYAPMAACMIALNFPTVEQAQHVFDALADSGQVTMPFAPTFWAERFGMVTDRFGIEWVINGNLAPK